MHFAKLKLREPRIVQDIRMPGVASQNLLVDYQSLPVITQFLKVKSLPHKLIGARRGDCH
ncbi:MAG TPA: hypothetical protein PKK10_06765 [Woeseiaceae bacterium]|nr:hypothetical protein [Woeseiaceae bacterium]